MAPVFALVSKNQTLKLAFEYFLLALAIFWFKSTGGFWLSLLVLISLTYLYLRTTAQASRFFIAAISLAILVFIFPINLEQRLNLISFSLFSSLVAYLLIGTKNIIFINRRFTSQLVYFLIWSGGAYMLFSAFSLRRQIFFFILSALLFKELYQFLTEDSRGVSLLKSLTLSLVALETAWAVSLLPFGMISSLILLIANIYMIHYLILNYESSLPDAKLVFKCICALLGIAFALSFFSNWNLS